MSVTMVLAVLFLIGGLAYYFARARAMRSAGGDLRQLHSLPHYYGMNALALSALPSLLVMLAWFVVEPIYLPIIIKNSIQPLPSDSGAISLIQTEIQRLTDVLSHLQKNGKITANTGYDQVIVALSKADFSVTPDTPSYLGLAQKVLAWKEMLRAAMISVVVILALCGAGYAWSRSTHNFKARNALERMILWVLFFTSGIAVVTTVGIILSMLFETLSFFETHPWQDFFFGPIWAPNFRGDSALSVLPLLWGTLYISLVALLVAVPLGLFAAIYMAEYASSAFRSVVKPVLEILAGIPTIVYGLFALLTVGPLVRDWIAEPAGLGNSSSSVLAAGLVMGIMLIPFVSSLSDDVINAVPQALRDGSLGLGATPSESVRFIILPAALPGIVASILLAASRAIGETMIVVLGAGAAAAQLNAGIGALVNPFEAMTTVTVKILSQLTGDTDFNSPETLVAFALGLTLFAITLGLNFFAVSIVRKYRERYE